MFSHGRHGHFGSSTWAYTCRTTSCWGGNISQKIRRTSYFQNRRNTNCNCHIYTPYALIWPEHLFLYRGQVPPPPPPSPVTEVMANNKKQFPMLPSFFPVLPFYPRWRSKRFVWPEIGFPLKNIDLITSMDPHKQYIQVDILYNYMFHFGLPGKCLHLSPQTHTFLDTCFRTFIKTFSWKSKMKHVVKYDLYLHILLMRSIYVIKSTFLRGNPISGNKNL